MPKILIIDDEPGILLVLEEIFSEEGYQVATAENGADGLAMLNKGLVPDLIFADLHMPKMGGRDFLETLRALYGQGMPVILLTGSVPDERLFPPSELYQDIVCKPFELDELLNKTKWWLSKNLNREE